MGHATYDEEGRPLPDRRNLVVSRKPTLVLPGAEVFPSVECAIESARETDPEPFVIGGAEVFRAALPYVTRILVTEIDRTYDGDTTFILDRSGFREVARRRGADPTLSFVTLERSAR
jgi:dihydrofolate reductase